MIKIYNNNLIFFNPAMFFVEMEGDVSHLLKMNSLSHCYGFRFAKWLSGLSLSHVLYNVRCRLVCIHHAIVWESPSGLISN